jgi:hypothetical protein
MGQMDSAKKYVEQTMSLADELKSRSRLTDSYEIAAKYYQKLGNFQKAYELQAN